MDIVLLPAFDDNYIPLLRAGNFTAVVDPGDAGVVERALEVRGIGQLDLIVCTHHHGDHTDGVGRVQARFGGRVVAGVGDAARIAERQEIAVDTVADEQRLPCGGEMATILAVPGHTSGHIAVWFAETGAALVGDTLLGLGCGRLFEGTPAMLWHSLLRLRALPDATRLYCGHEYTLANLQFVRSLGLGETPAVQEYARRVEALRDRGEPTMPVSLAEERAANPFLRADDPAIAVRLGLAGEPAVAVFTELRRRKDVF